MTSTGQKLVVVLGLVAIPESARSALPVASNTILAGETSSFSLERRRSDLAIAWAWTLNYRRRGEGWPGNRRPFKWRIANSDNRTLDHHFYPPTRHLAEGCLAGFSGALGGGIRCLNIARRAVATCPTRKPSLLYMSIIALHLLLRTLTTTLNQLHLESKKANKVFILPFRRTTTLPLCTR